MDINKTIKVGLIIGSCVDHACKDHSADVQSFLKKIQELVLNSQSLTSHCPSIFIAACTIAAERMAIELDTFAIEEIKRMSREN